MSSGILVTGATGFIGSHLAPELRRRRFPVYAHSRTDADIARGPLEFDGVRHVIHLAAKTFVPDSWDSPHAFYEVNVLGTVNILEFCRRSGASVTFLSSYVYGTPLHLPITEEHPLQPYNPYCHTKILAEEVVEFYRAKFGVHATIVRPFNVYGPGQDQRFIIPAVVAQAVDPCCKCIMVADLRPRRDYLNVRDLVDLIIDTIDSPGGIYNAGSGQSISVEQLVAEVQSLAGLKKPVGCRREARPGEVSELVADISRAKADFGWSPRIPLRDGLREIVEQMRAGL